MALQQRSQQRLEADPHHHHSGVALERRLTTMEREQREQAASMHLLMELVQESMPIAQCHELLASLEQRVVSTTARPPAVAASKDGSAAAALALRGDVDALLRSQKKAEHDLSQLETAVSKLPDAAAIDRSVTAAVATEGRQIQSSAIEQVHTELKSSEERVQRQLAEELGRELAEAVKEMAEVAEITRQAADDGVEALAERLERAEAAVALANETVRIQLDDGLEQATASFESTLQLHQADLSKLRSETAHGTEKATKLVEGLQAELQQCQDQALSTLNEVRAVEALQTAFEAGEQARKQEATDAFDGLMEDVEEYVTKQMLEYEGRQQHHTDSAVSAQRDEFAAQVAAIAERCTAIADRCESETAKATQETAALNTRCTAVTDKLGEELAATVDAMSDELGNIRDELLRSLETRVAATASAADQQNADARADLESHLSLWRRCRQDDADQLDRVARGFEQAAVEREAEYGRQLSSVESRLLHSLQVQTDAHEQWCADLKREVASASAMLRREHNDGLTQVQLEAQSTTRDLATLRRELEQAQLSAVSSLEVLTLKIGDEQTESQRQIDARIMQLSTECRDMVASSRRSFERQLESTTDTISRQRSEGDAHEAAERDRLSLQLQQLATAVKRTATEDTAARTTLSRAITQQIADSATTSASAVGALASRFDAMKTELEATLSTASGMHASQTSSLSASLTQKIDSVSSELSATLRENGAVWSTQLAQMESKALGGLEQLQTELKAHRAEGLRSLSEQDERLSNAARELAIMGDEQAQHLRTDMVSRSEAAHASLIRAMTEVESSLATKADRLFVETVDAQLREAIAELEGGAADTTTKLHHLSDRIDVFQESVAVTNTAMREDLGSVDKAMRRDFLKSSLGLRKDFAAADLAVEGKLQELGEEMREGLGKMLTDRVIELEGTVSGRVGPLEEALRGCATKNDVAVQLGVMKMDLAEARSAVGELEERAEEVRTEGALLQAEVAELAVEVSLMDAASASTAQ